MNAETDRPLDTRHSRRYYDDEDRPRRIATNLLSVLTMLAGLYYIGWAVFNASPAHPVAGTVLLVFEILCFWLFFLATLGLWRLRFKPPEGLQGEEKDSVDVFITTCREDFALVSKTMRAATQIKYGGKLSLYVLDDGPSDEVKALAEELGMIYLSRARAGVARENAKAGNLNYGLEHSNGDLVLTLDADQVPQPDIVSRMAGYMRFERVAFVQSKQQYDTPASDPFYNSSKVFYESVQLGLDNIDSVVACGTGVLYSRKALQDIGGFASWNIVEDLTTSYELHSRGWRSFYFPHALSKGVSPSSIWGVYQQRGQWALDTMRIFFWDNPLFKKGLPLRAKVNYTTIAMSYLFSALLLPYFYILPIWTFLTGQSIFDTKFPEYLIVRSAYFALMILTVHFMCYGREPSKQFQHIAGMFPVYLRGILRALIYPKGKRKPTYRVNNARVTRHKWANLPPLVAVLPQLVIVLLNVLTPFYALLMETCPPKLILSNCVLSGFTIWALSGIILAAFAKNEPAKGEGLSHG